MLEARFGDAASFLATWLAWRNDADRCEYLEFIAVEPRPPARAALTAGDHRDPRLAPLADQLQRAWPPLTPDLHAMHFEGGRVRLLLAVGELPHWLTRLETRIDCLALGAADFASEPHDAHLAKRLARLSAPGATLTLPRGDPLLPGRLASAGFEVDENPETCARAAFVHARFVPRFAPRPAPRSAAAGGPARRAIRPTPATAAPHAVIVGAGLAGCAAAWALAECGWRSTVIDRAGRIASQASGNGAGLFHGTLNEPDGLHARFNRAASVAAHAAVRAAVEGHRVRGATDGMLRLERTLDVAAMRAMLQRLRLPPDYLQALDAAQASAVAGLALCHPAWFFAGGGWVHPAGLARAYLERAGAAATLRLGVEVHAVRREGEGWRLLDAVGGTLAESEMVVLANAADAQRLVGEAEWPLESMRGQISQLPAADAPFALPRVPIAGAGYLLPPIDAMAVFGATAQAGDADARVRIADHHANLAQLERLIGRRVEVDAASLQGRTAWRCTSADRLPLIGAVPDAALARVSERIDQPRFVPRLPGLFVFTALGSRGITWSALGAQVLAAGMTGATPPIETALLDAVDPARFISRRARRAGGR